MHLGSCNDNRITKLEELENAANSYLLRFQQGLSTLLCYYLHCGLCSLQSSFYDMFMTLLFIKINISGFLQRPPIVTSSKLIENIIKKNETKRLKSYIDAGCVNIHDAVQSTRACELLINSFDLSLKISQFSCFRNTPSAFLFRFCLHIASFVLFFFLTTWSSVSYLKKINKYRNKKCIHLYQDFLTT